MWLAQVHPTVPISMPATCQPRKAGRKDALQSNSVLACGPQSGVVARITRVQPLAIDMREHEAHHAF